MSTAAAIDRWADAGYSAETIALVLGNNVQTIRKHRTGFGRKRLPRRWEQVLRKEYWVSFILAPAFEWTKRQYPVAPGWTRENARVVWPVLSQETVDKWLEHFDEVLWVKKKLLSLDLKLSEKQGSISDKTPV